MPLFEVAILEHPTPKELEDGQSERIVLSPVAVVASTPQAAAISAVLDQPITVHRSRMEVLVRPFLSA